MSQVIPTGFRRKRTSKLKISCCSRFWSSIDRVIQKNDIALSGTVKHNPYFLRRLILPLLGKQ